MKTVRLQNGSRPARALEMANRLKPAAVTLADDDRRRLNRDVARTLGQDTSSREQPVAEARPLLIHQMEFRI